MAVRDRFVNFFLGPGARRPRQNAVEVAQSGMARLYMGIAQSLVTPSLDQPGLSQTPLSFTDGKRNPIILAPVWLISFRLGSIPIKTYRLAPSTVTQPKAPMLAPGSVEVLPSSNGGAAPLNIQESEAGTPGRIERQEADDHPAYRKLRVPNPVLTRNLMISGTVAGMFTSRGVGWLKERVDNTPFVFDYYNGIVVPGTGHSTDPRINPLVNLWPVPANVLFPVRDAQKIIRAYELRVPGWEPEYIPFEDMCYFRLMPDPEDWAVGMSPLQALADTASWGNTIVQRAEQTIRDAILQRFAIALKGDIDDTAEANLIARFARARSNPGEAPIIPADASIENIGDSLNPEVIISSLEASKDLVKYVFGLPADASREDFYADVVAPVADAMEQEMERSLMPEWPADPAFPEFQFRQILAGTPLQRAQLHRERIYSGQETPNEARGEENRPPLPGGDFLMGPMNLTPLPGQGFLTPQLQQASAEGFGGQQGQGTKTGTTIKTGGPEPPPGSRTGGAGQRLGARDSAGTSAKIGAGGGQVSLRAMDDQWQAMRDRVVGSQSLALSRRIRGVLRQEQGHLQEPDPFLPEIVARSDREIATLLYTFMRQAAEGALEMADGQPRVGIDSLPPQLDAELQSRAVQIAGAFGEHRTNVAFRPDFDLVTAWTDLRDNFAAGIAERAVGEAFDNVTALVDEQTLVPASSSVQNDDVPEEGVDGSQAG